MPTLLYRDASGAAVSGAGSSISLGVIITIAVLGTVFVAVGGGLLCAWIARHKRRQRRLTRRQQEEEMHREQMASIAMMQDVDQTAPAGAHAAPQMAAGLYLRSTFSDCGSSTCCSLASSDMFSTSDAEFEGSGVTWWWRCRWRRFWHGQRRWMHRQSLRASSHGAGSGSDGEKQNNHCQHGHGHHGHHHHRRGTADGSPRKLRRRRPETAIIASTNSLFFPSFTGDDDILSNAHNDHANADIANSVSLRKPAPAYSAVRPNSFPQRPPPPAEQQRLLPSGQGQTGQNSQNAHNGPWTNRSSMPNMPNRYPPQIAQPSLQPQPQTSSRSLPRPPQPALIIPDRPDSKISPGVPFHPNPNFTPQQQQQQHQMMLMMQQHMQQHFQQPQPQQQPQQQPRRTSYKTLLQNVATDSALSEILRSTEQRLQQLQSQTSPSSGSLRRASTAAVVGMDSDAAGHENNDDDEKRASQTSGSDADSMYGATNSKHVNQASRGAYDDNSSPILDAIPTALSSPSKSPGKNRVAAGSMMLPAPAQSAIVVSNQSPDTRSASSVYSSPASSRSSSLSTVYSVDEREPTAGDGLAGVHIVEDGLAGLGISGTGVEEALEVSKDLVVPALATPKRASVRRTSAGLTADLSAPPPRMAVPDLPLRSPKRSPRRSAIVTPSMVMMGGGIMIPHSSSSANLSSVTGNSNPDIIHNNMSSFDTTINTTNGTIQSGATSHSRNRHNRNSMVWQQAPQTASAMSMANSGIRLSFGVPAGGAAPVDNEASDASDKEDVFSLVPGRLNPRTSWGLWNSANVSLGASNNAPSPPKHGRRSLKEAVEAMQAAETMEAEFESEDQLSRQSTRPLPRPLPAQPVPVSSALLSASNANHRNTVVATAAELRRMNSVAYSETSSCYSNATSAAASVAPSVAALPISTAASSLGVSTGRRSGGRRRNSSAGEAASASNAANTRTSIGSRQYLSLGKGLTTNGANSAAGLDKENRDSTSPAKRASAPPPQRVRSARTMTMATTGTALRRVDENPASGASTPMGTPRSTSKGTPKNTPKGTPKNTPKTLRTPSSATPKANTGKQLRKSPSRATQVGSATPTGSPGKLRAKALTGPSTPTRGTAVAWQPGSRDSLGLYDQDGFLLSSPMRAS